MRGTLLSITLVLATISKSLTAIIDRDVIIAPTQKVLWCAIEKVGSATTRTLMGDLNRVGNQDAVSKAHGQAMNFGWTNLQYQLALEDSSWSKVIFVRDPVARFISGWSSKCTPGHDSDRGHCEHAFGAINVTLLQAVEALTKCSEPVASADPAWKKRCRMWQGRPDKLNIHWRPQHFFCGGMKTLLPHYQSVEELSGNVTGKLLKVLHQAGVAQPEKLSSLARISSVERKAGKQISQLSSKHATHASGSMLDAYPEQRRIIEKFYEEDYRLFRQRGALKAGPIL